MIVVEERNKDAGDEEEEGQMEIEGHSASSPDMVRARSRSVASKGCTDPRSLVRIES